MAEFVLSAFVRIDSTNNQLRITDAGTDRTFTLTQGTYALGFGQSSPGGGASDSASYGFTSLLEQMNTDFNNVASFNPVPGAAPAWVWGLQTNYNDGWIPAAATGYVAVDSDDAITSSLLFNHSSTTMSPEWFGVGKTNGVYNNHQFASTSPEVVSDFSSVLTIVGSRTIGAEGLIEQPKDRGFLADDGTAYWESLGDGVDILRELILNGSGLPRDSADSDFHTFRRFMRHLRLNQAGRRFYYFPDISLLTWGAYDPNDTAAGRRWGQQEMKLDPRQPISFRDPKRYPTYNQEWQVRLPVINHV